MENKSSNGWKFFALLFGALLAGVVGLYIYKQQNPDYDPWEEPWENSSSPVDLGLTKDAERRKPPDFAFSGAPMPRWVCCFALYLAIQGFSFAFAIAIDLRPSVVLSLYCHVRPARTFGHYRHTQSDMRKTYEKALGKSQGPSSSSLIRPLRNGRNGSDHAYVGDAGDVS